MNKRYWLLILLLCTGLFLFGLVELFLLRFEAGDVYPPYSSLRADPLGTRALYESLARMPGLSLQRDFNANDRLPDGREATYLHLAAERFEWASMAPELVNEIDAFLARGGRLAITFFPETSEPHFRFLSGTNAAGIKKPPAKQAQATPNKSATNAPPKAAPLTPPGKKTLGHQQEDEWVSLKEHWGVEFGLVRLPAGQGTAYEAVSVVNQTDLPLPEQLHWHSAMVFTNVVPSWQTIYSRGTNAVVIERRFGRGSVVMASDSYFLSNEALAADRHADLLAWLLGSGKNIFFDEAHLGIIETPGAAKLMRQYRLHGLAVALLLLAALFIWKNALSFVPPYPDEQEAEHLAGQDAAAGFINLLRRNIAPRDLLRVCFAEWAKSLPANGAHIIARVDQAQTVLEAESARAQVGRDPVRAYREICRVLKGKQGQPTGLSNRQDKLDA
jgi:hypothetical protein